MHNKLYKTKQFIYVIFFLIIPFVKVYAFDLNEAYQKAIAYNADYLSQIAKTEAGQESWKQARAQLLPQVTAQGNINENYYSINGTSTYYYFHQPIAQVNLSQAVIDFNKFSTYVKGKYAAQLTDLQLENMKQGLIVTVARAYFDVLNASDIVDAIKMKKNVFEQQLIQNQKKFDAGVVNVTDVNDAKSAFDGANAELIQKQNDLIYKKNIFSNLTGLNPDLIQPLTDQINLISPNPNSVDAWAALAFENNLNIKIYSKQVQMAVEDMRIAKAGHLPTVSVMGSYSYNGAYILDGADSQQTIANTVPGSSAFSGNTAIIGLQLNVPLYTGGDLSSKVREKMANYESMQQQLLGAQRTADQEVKNAFWQAQNGINLVNAQTQALKSAALKLKSDKLGYQVGTRNSIDLVNSQKNYYAILQDYNKARYDYLVASLQLQYNAGQINLDVLKTINMNVKQ